MRASIAVLYLAIVLVGLVLAVRIVVSGSGEDRGGEERPASAAGGEAPETSGEGGAAATTVDREEAARSERSGDVGAESDVAPARLVVRLVLEGSDTPLSELDALAWLEGATEGVSATSDASGEARFEVPPGMLRHVRIEGNELVSPQWIRARAELSSGQETNLRLEVPVGRFVSGRAVDEVGRAVAGARVVGTEIGIHSEAPVEVTAADDGSFRVGPFRERLSVYAEAPGLVTRHVVDVFVLPRVDPGEVELVLVPTVALHGLVASRAGGVAGATVRATRREYQSVREGVYLEGPRPVETVSAADGRFELLCVGLPLEVTVRCDGFLPWEGGHDPASGGALAVPLDAGASVSGTVRNRDAAPVAEARIRLSASGPDDIPDQTTGPDGRYSFTGLLAEDGAYLFVRADGYREFEAEFLLGPAGNERHVVLDRCAPITGAVLGVDGAPVDDAAVHLASDAERVLSGHWEAQARTDAEGKFRFGSLPPGDGFCVMSRGRWRQSWERPWIRSETVECVPGDDVTLRLDAEAFRGVAFVGDVRDAVTGAPIERFTGTFFVGNSGTTHEFYDGRFERAGYAPDQVLRLVFEAPGHARREIAARRYAPGDHHLDVRLPPRREITFRLVGRDGRPAAGAALSIVDLDGTVLSQPTGLSSGAQWLETGGDGLVEARAVPGGPCSVATSPYIDGPERRAPLDFTVAPVGEVEVVVDEVEWIEQAVGVYGTSDPTATPERLEELLDSGAAWPIAREEATVYRSFAAPGTGPIWRWSSKEPGADPTTFSLRLPVVPVRLRVTAKEHVRRELPAFQPDGSDRVVVLLQAAEPR